MARKRTDLPKDKLFRDTLTSLVMNHRGSRLNPETDDYDKWDVERLDHYGNTFLMILQQNHVKFRLESAYTEVSDTFKMRLVVWDPICQFDELEFDMRFDNVREDAEKIAKHVFDKFNDIALRPEIVDCADRRDTPKLNECRKYLRANAEELLFIGHRQATLFGYASVAELILTCARFEDQGLIRCAVEYTEGSESATKDDIIYIEITITTTDNSDAAKILGYRNYRHLADVWRHLFVRYNKNYVRSRLDNSEIRIRFEDLWK